MAARGGRGSRRGGRSSTTTTTKAAAVQRQHGGSKPMSPASRMTTTTMKMTTKMKTTRGAISWDGTSPPLPLAARSLSAPPDTLGTIRRMLRGTDGCGGEGDARSLRRGRGREERRRGAMQRCSRRSTRATMQASAIPSTCLPPHSRATVGRYFFIFIKIKIKSTLYNVLVNLMSLLVLQ